MKRTTTLVGLLLFGSLATGCAPYYAPNAGRAGYPVRSMSATPAADPYSSRGRWDNVMRLPAGASIEVLTWYSGARAGRIASADGASIRILIDGAEEEIFRRDVVRVDLVDLPGSEAGAVARRAAGGALIGMGGATIVSAVIGGAAWPPPAVSLRAGAALGALAASQAELINRRGRMIYLSEDLHGPGVQFVPHGAGEPSDRRRCAGVC